MLACLFRKSELPRTIFDTEIDQNFETIMVDYFHLESFAAFEYITPSKFAGIVNLIVCCGDAVSILSISRFVIYTVITVYPQKAC